MKDGDGLTCPACKYEAAAAGDLLRRVRSRPMIGAGIAVVAASPAVFWCALYVHTWMALDSLDARFGIWNSAAVGVVAFGAAVFIAGHRGDRSRGRRRCPKCWYDMSGSASLRCPECGRDAANVRRLYRPRRRRRVMYAGVAIALAAVVPYEYPRVRAGGWVAAIPTTAMIVGFRWLPEHAIMGANGWWGGDDWTLAGRISNGSLWGWQRALLRWRCARGVNTSNPSLLLRLAMVAAGTEPSTEQHGPAPGGWSAALATNTFRRFLDAPVPAPVSLAQAAGWCAWHHSHQFTEADCTLLATRMSSPSPDDAAAACRMIGGPWSRGVALPDSGASVVAPSLLALLDHPNRLVTTAAVYAVSVVLSRHPPLAEDLRRVVQTDPGVAGRHAAGILARTAREAPDHAAFLREQIDSGSDAAANHSFSAIVWYLEGDAFEALTSDESIVNLSIAQLRQRKTCVTAYAEALDERPAQAALRLTDILPLMEHPDSATAAIVARAVARLAAADPGATEAARGAMGALLKRLRADPATAPNLVWDVQALLDSLPEP